MPADFSCECLAWQRLTGGGGNVGPILASCAPRLQFPCLTFLINLNCGTPLRLEAAIGIGEVGMAGRFGTSVRESGRMTKYSLPFPAPSKLNLGILTTFCRDAAVHCFH